MCIRDSQTVNADAGVCTYTVTGTESPDWDATATDNCSVSDLYYTLTGATTGGGSISFTSLDGVVFNLGTTTVTWTAVDTSGNTDVCSYTVTVLDTQNPVISCPSNGNQTVNADAGACTYTVTGTESPGWDATATDNCSVSDLYYTLTGATTGGGSISFTSLDNVVFNLGTTTVTWIAIDTSGNADTCSYTVTVLDCLLYTSPSPRDRQKSRMPSSA